MILNNFADSGVNLNNEGSPSTHKASPTGGTGGEEEVLRKLLLANDDDEYHQIMYKMRTGKTTNSTSKPETSTEVSPSSNNSNGSKGSENNQLLKVLYICSWCLCLLVIYGYSMYEQTTPQVVFCSCFNDMSTIFILLAVLMRKIWQTIHLIS